MASGMACFDPHFREPTMKTINLALWFTVIAESAFALPPSHVGAPAPLIGMGLQGAIAVGGMLLGSKLFKRWKQK